MEDLILRFISGDGYGYGSGDGYGYGSGYGDGYGYGYGSGDGYGYGSGYGSGSGVKSYNGQNVYMIDEVPTLIDRLRGESIAKGRILRDDLTTMPCFIVKQDGLFAHGETLSQAREALLEKLFDDMPEDDRIRAFAAAFTPGRAYPNKAFFDWHHRLTGSCEMGRREFAKNHQIDVENGNMTPEAFIRLTEHDYGGRIIQKLREFYPKT